MNCVVVSPNKIKLNCVVVVDDNKTGVNVLGLKINRKNYGKC
jgi:hypothetical protein